MLAQLELTQVGGQRELTHIGAINRELTHVEVILGSLSGNKQNRMEKGNFLMILIKAQQMQ